MAASSINNSMMSEEEMRKRAHWSEIVPFSTSTRSNSPISKVMILALVSKGDKHDYHHCVGLKPRE
jgi:hypothetical protein